MTRRLNTLEQASAFVSPWIKSKLDSKVLYWSYLDVTTACNMRCGYCHVIESKGSLIDISKAKQSIDFIYNHGGRMLALMGGEPLLLGDSLTQIIEYATTRKIFTYLPTNISILNEALLEDLVNAGICAIDVAIDSIEKRTGFDKNLEESQENFELVLNSRKNGVYVKLNTVITHENIEDVYKLVELSHDKNIPISLHLIESAMPGTEQKDYHWLQDSWHFNSEDSPVIEKLASWLK